MSVRRRIIAALSEDSLGGIATLSDVDEAVQLVDAHAAEVLAGITNPGDAATVYADRLCVCVCDETPHPTWCPASVPTDDRITEIRDGVGDPLTPRELSWLRGAAARHEMHVVGSRGGHWPLQDPAGGLLLMSQYLAAAVAVIERAGLVEEQAADAEFFRPGRTYVREHHAATIRFLVRYLDDSPCGTYKVAFGWRIEDGDVTWSPSDSDDFGGWVEAADGGAS